MESSRDIRAAKYSGIESKPLADPLAVGRDAGLQSATALSSGHGTVGHRITDAASAQISRKSHPGGTIGGIAGMLASAPIATLGGQYVRGLTRGALATYAPNLTVNNPRAVDLISQSAQGLATGGIVGTATAAGAATEVALRNAYRRRSERKARESAAAESVRQRARQESIANPGAANPGAANPSIANPPQVNTKLSRIKVEDLDILEFAKDVVPASAIAVAGGVYGLGELKETIKEEGPSGIPMMLSGGAIGGGIGSALAPYVGGATGALTEGAAMLIAPRYARKVKDTIGDVGSAIGGYATTGLLGYIGYEAGRSLRDEYDPPTLRERILDKLY